MITGGAIPGVESFLIDAAYVGPHAGNGLDLHSVQVADPGVALCGQAAEASGSVKGHARAKVRSWTPDEDERLVAAVARLGHDWSLVAEAVGGGRNKGQCSQRWIRGLNPGLKKDPWTPDEDKQLMMGIQKHGNCWRKIAAEIEGRCDVQCRYRWMQMKRMNVPDVVPCGVGNCLASAVASCVGAGPPGAKLGLGVLVPPMPTVLATGDFVSSIASQPSDWVLHGFLSGLSPQPSFGDVQA